MITHQHFSYCRAVLTQSKGLPATCAALPASGWKGTEPGQLTQTSQRSVHMASCWGKEGGRGNIHSDGACFPKKVLHVMGPAFLKVTEHLPAHGKYEWIPCCTLLACVAFSLPNKLSSPESVSSCTFSFPFLSPIPLGVSEQVAVLLNHKS